MKKLILLVLTFILSNSLFGQASGNINYQNQVSYSDNNINVSIPSNSIIRASVKGLANVKADSYVAIFSVTQVGKTTEEVNRLIDTRINQAIEKIKLKPNVTTLIDIISFVPVYEYEVNKKIFSKNTYNEIPAGFELKKNIHIQYTDPDLLNEIISELSIVEIYDFVRVDYFSTKLESIKKELRTKSKTLLQEKLNDYQLILGKNLDSLNKNIADGFKVVLPVEAYKSYQSYTNSSLNLKKSANVNNANKTTTSYYQPIIDKEFDFVLNPIILEPVIQVLYEIKMNIENTNVKENTVDYILVTPNGDLKGLNLKE